MGKNRHTTDEFEDMQIAKQLGYPKIVLELLLKEPNRDKRSEILRNARLGRYGK